VEPETDAEREACPFCGGREDRTPPETLRLGDPWRVRVVPNLYPAFERHEVVIHTPEHLRTVADLRDEQLDVVAQAWQDRARAAPGYVHAILNEGRAAGGSLPHSHSQLIWMPSVPPAVAAERGGDVVLEGEIVEERDGLVLLAPPAPRVPYELRIVPAGRESSPWTSDLLAPALRLLADTVRRLHAIAGGPTPLNAWLHHGDWWHLELLPRLTVLAGVELGAGIYVVTTPPEEAAAALRKAEDRP
jgi:UDPglucose--hexose-1-phosphate uridylyltransferase